MTDPSVLRSEFEAAVQAAVDADRQNSAKWKPLYRWYAKAFAAQKANPDDITGKLLTEDKQLSNRISKELAADNPRYVVFARLPEVDAAKVREELLTLAALPRAAWTLLCDGSNPVRLLVHDPGDPLLAPLRAIFPGIPEEAAPLRSAAAPAAAPGAAAKAPPFGPRRIVVDDRVRQMIRTALATYQGVILVGPPGTGKTTLLMEEVERVISNPAAAGFSKAVNPPLVVTPEESWTNRDLIGGETVDEAGRLRFRPGRLLDAIANNRWLILDEINRADMDKILGAVLTWLAGSPVSLGRAALTQAAPSMELGWSAGGASCVCERVEELYATEPKGSPIRWLAGSEWRLLGTYNAVDAQRVFRFGHALGRRFARIPVPPATAEEFSRAIVDPTRGLPPLVEKVIQTLYGAHLATPQAELGPAFFLRIPDYVRKALALGAAADDASISRLLAEGYVVAVGTWLARLEESDLSELRKRASGVPEGLPDADWSWIEKQIRLLA